MKNHVFHMPLIQGASGNKRLIADLDSMQLSHAYFDSIIDT